MPASCLAKRHVENVHQHARLHALAPKSFHRHFVLVKLCAQLLDRLSTLKIQELMFPQAKEKTCFTCGIVSSGLRNAWRPIHNSLATSLSLVATMARLRMRLVEGT